MKFRVCVDVNRWRETLYFWEYENGTRGSLSGFTTERGAYDDAIRTIKANRDREKYKKEITKDYPKTFEINEDEL